MLTYNLSLLFRNCHVCNVTFTVFDFLHIASEFRYPRCMSAACKPISMIYFLLDSPKNAKTTAFLVSRKNLLFFAIYHLRFLVFTSDHVNRWTCVSGSLPHLKGSRSGDLLGTLRELCSNHMWSEDQSCPLPSTNASRVALAGTFEMQCELATPHRSPHSFNRRVCATY